MIIPSIYSRNLLQEEIFVNHMILLSEEIFTIFDYRIHSRRYIARRYVDPKCMLALIFANAFEIGKLTELKDLQ